ncbi:HAMP domain-containing sensor histidine kinase [Dehalogenimonas sp. THU2]|uniref:sensor histidine kinase n=1 Tax=Dehalogenimonas sp. THU2 TaxID=3151121 RepID=UPI003218A28E
MNIFRSIKSLLTVWYLSVLAALLLFFATLGYFLLSNDLNRSLDSSLKHEATHLGNLVTLANGVISPPDENLFDFAAWSLDIALLFDKNGNLVRGWGQTVKFSDIEDPYNHASSGSGVFATVSQPDGDRLRLYAVPLREGPVIIGVIFVGRSTQEVSQVLSTLTTIQTIGGFAALVLAGVGGLFLANRALKPIDDITYAAQEISETDLSRRLDIHVDDELGGLARTLNQMIARLERAFIRQRQFTGDASHELRTPLSIIQAESSLALNKPRTVDDYRKSLELVKRESVHMSILIDRLLFLARSDAGQQKFDCELIDLTGLVVGIVSEIEPVCAEKGLTCSMKHAENTSVLGEVLSLRQLFFNLLDNAIRYTPAGGRVSVSVKQEDRFGIVTINDTGVGIPPEHLAHIFERFYRVDQSRSKSDGGSGLGLSISEEITGFFGGKIEVKSQIGIGSTFTVYLPLTE